MIISKDKLQRFSNLKLTKKKEIIYNSKSKMKLNIYGAGPTGALLTLALAYNNYNVKLIDPKSEEQILNNSRGYASTHSTRKLFQEIGIWDDVRSCLHPFTSLILEDRVCSRSILFKPKDLPSLDRNSQSIGWMLDHSSLMNILFRKIDQKNNITLKLETVSDYNQDSFDFAIAADGVNSYIRHTLGIKSFKFNYKQSCLAMRVLLRGLDQSKAYEILRSEGPFAVLPMGNNVYQIVWSAPKYLCERRLKLKPSLLLDKIAAILPEGAQPDLLLDKPQNFDVSLSFTPRFFKSNTLLIGESAHTFHPVGGQGLNISWRDIKSLLPLLNNYRLGKINFTYLKIFYSINRYIDVLSIAFVTHSIIKIFSNKITFLYFLRKLCFYILIKSRIARRMCLKIMTNGLVSNNKYY